MDTNRAGRGGESLRAGRGARGWLVWRERCGWALPQPRSVGEAVVGRGADCGGGPGAVGAEGAAAMDAEGGGVGMVGGSFHVC